MEKVTQREGKISKSSFLLIILCFFVYYIAYLGRYSYSSNINPVIDYFGVNKASAGGVGTSFFIFYGVGQVINGLLCKKYNPRYAISLALLFSALSNFAVGLTNDESFYILKFFWMVNGFAQSVLWSSIIRLLNGNLPKKHLNTAIFIMGLPVSLGTFTIYGLSSLISALNLSFKFVFFLSALLLTVIGLIWFLSVNKIKKRCLQEKFEADGDNKPEENKEREGSAGVTSRAFIITFCILAVFAIANNFVKDGLTTWMPTILKEKYSLENSISTFLTLFLPFFAVFGSTVAIFLNKKCKNFILVCGILYFVAFALFGVVLIFFNSNSWIFPLVCFILIACSMSGVNNVITNIFPMLYSNNSNAGAIAGVLDGFCYLGSAITAYGMGSVADSSGWKTVFWLFISICFLMIIICGIYFTVSKNKKVR